MWIANDDTLDVYRPPRPRGNAVGVLKQNLGDAPANGAAADQCDIQRFGHVTSR